MKIGIISQWYAPEPIFIAGNLAGELARRGHEVRALTAFPNYPQGRIQPGYRQRWNHQERAAGVNIRRVPIYPSHDNSPLRRVANLGSFAATSLLAAPRFLAGVDVVYAYCPPPTVFAAPFALRVLRGVPVLLHVQDMWPESVSGSDLAPGGLVGSAMDRALHVVMRGVYRASAGIAVISESMAELVIERGADPARVRVVLNWTDETLFRPVPPSDGARAEIGHRGRCTIMFAGNMGPFQRVETAIRAAAANADLVDLVLVGSGTEEADARRLADELGADNIRFVGRRAPEEMSALYAASDFQLVILRDLPALRGTVPSKLQAALACARPVIVSAAGDAATLVTASGVGLAAPAEDWRALAERFAAAAALPSSTRADMGRRAQQMYRDRMSLRVGVDQIEDMLTKMTSARGTV
ncbi:glycosyltransferase family 4 protein [Micromonospora sp. NPDC005305]|uniref:glycosyltransferase family 4 protein n=1 Tax=Micromonospora sp. NPDC005305 TaxID=3156875 RepID=UPI0033BC7472